MQSKVSRTGNIFYARFAWETELCYLVTSWNRVYHATSCSLIPFEINLFDTYNRQFFVRIIAADNSIPVHEE